MDTGRRPPPAPAPLTLRRSLTAAEMHTLANRATSVASLVSSLHAEDRTARLLVTPFVDAMVTGKARLWDGKSETAPWPENTERPVVFVDESIAAPEDIERRSLEAVVERSIDVRSQASAEGEQVDGASGSPTGSVRQLRASMQANRPENVFFVIDAGMDTTISIPDRLLVGRELFGPRQLEQRVDITPRFTLVDLHIGWSEVLFHAGCSLIRFR